MPWHPKPWQDHALARKALTRLCPDTQSPDKTMPWYPKPWQDHALAPKALTRLCPDTKALTRLCKCEIWSGSSWLAYGIRVLFKWFYITNVLKFPIYESLFSNLGKIATYDILKYIYIFFTFPKISWNFMPNVSWGVVGMGKVSCILRHRGVQMLLAYSWARPTILEAGKCRDRMFFILFFFCFFTFITVPLSSLSLSFISSTISSISFLPFSGRRHKMTHKGWHVVTTQTNNNKCLRRHLAWNSNRIFW